MQKLILCTTSTKNSGKTEFLNKVIEKFEKERCTVVDKNEEDKKEDLYTIFSLNGKNVLIQTNGDDKAAFNRIKRLATKHSVELIICPTRSRGQEQYKNLEKIAEKCGYKVFWFRHFFMEEHPTESLKDIMTCANKELARAIFNFVKDYLSDKF